MYALSFDSRRRKATIKVAFSVLSNMRGAKYQHENDESKGNSK